MGPMGMPPPFGGPPPGFPGGPPPFGMPPPGFPFPGGFPPPWAGGPPPMGGPMGPPMGPPPVISAPPITAVGQISEDASIPQVSLGFTRFYWIFAWKINIFKLFFGFRSIQRLLPRRQNGPSIVPLMGECTTTALKLAVLSGKSLKLLRI